MKISETIEAHLYSAVATISQRHQATPSEQAIKHPIFPLFNCLYRLAKATGFCLYFYTNFITIPGTVAGKETLHG
jgi:hypothetical protein